MKLDILHVLIALIALVTLLYLLVTADRDTPADKRLEEVTRETFKAEFSL